MDLLERIARYGSICGGSVAELTPERDIAEPKERKRRPREMYATEDEIQMCLNCTKKIKKHGCEERRFRSCVREMKQRKDEES